MTPDEHQRERRAFWDGVCIALCPPPTPFPQMDADALLAERDKRFPAPSAISEPGSVDELVQWTKRAPAAAPVEAMAGSVGRDVSYDAGYSDGAESVMQGMPTNAELTALRRKARLWDAVASGKVRIDYNLQDTYGAFYGPIGKGKRTDNMDTAEEAVEAAIAAGALK